MSHAHSDHLGEHEHAICTPATMELSALRVGAKTTTALRFGERYAFDRDTHLTLLSAGHVLGSAMLQVDRPEGRLLYTGDFKLRPCLTVEATQTSEADVLVMESTFGKPIFRFPPRETVIAELLDRVTRAIADGRQPIVLGYSLGKAQEIVRVLTAAGLNVTCHGAVAKINRAYERLGVSVGTWRTYDPADFRGAKAIGLAERGVLVAPPQVARTSFVTQFDRPLSIMLSGWAMLPGAQFRYGVDHVLPLSDHADFDELLELIERVKPKKIFTHHGFKEFADTLRGMGLDAKTAKTDAQLSLFD